MNISIVIATYGDPAWEELAWSRAYPSAIGQGALQAFTVYHRDATLAEARNLGAEQAKGAWLCFLDADDELAPGYLDAMRLAWAKHKGWGGQTVQTNSGPRPTRLSPLVAPPLLVPSVQYIDPLGYESKPRVLNDGRPLHDINRAVIGTLVPRELFLAVGGFRDLPAWEDWDLFLRMEHAGAELLDVPEAIYRAFVNRSGRNARVPNPRALYARIRADNGITI